MNPTTAVRGHRHPQELPAELRQRRRQKGGDSFGYVVRVVHPGGVAGIRHHFERGIRLAEENRAWGYRHIHGEVHRFGHPVTTSTMWKILRTVGLDPAADRTGPTWMEFIRSQAARNFLMRLRDDHGFRFLIRDGAGQFARFFDDVLTGSGITAIRIPPRSPQANVFAESCVPALRHELLDQTIIWNERQLHTLLVEYIDHYNAHRPSLGVEIVWRTVARDRFWPSRQHISAGVVHAATRSNDEQRVPDSSTSTDPQPEPPQGQPETKNGPASTRHDIRRDDANAFQATSLDPPMNSRHEQCGRVGLRGLGRDRIVIPRSAPRRPPGDLPRRLPLDGGHLADAGFALLLTFSRPHFTLLLTAAAE